MHAHNRIANDNRGIDWRTIAERALFAHLWTLAAATAATGVIILAVFAGGDDDYFPYRKYRDLMLYATVFASPMPFIGIWLLDQKLWQPIAIGVLFLTGMLWLSQIESALQMGMMLIGLAMLMGMFVLILITDLRTERHE